MWIYLKLPLHGNSEKNVFRLKIPMHDAAAMDVLQPVHDLQHYPLNPVRLLLPADRVQIIVGVIQQVIRLMAEPRVAAVLGLYVKREPDWLLFDPPVVEPQHILVSQLREDFRLPYSPLIN